MLLTLPHSVLTPPALMFSLLVSALGTGAQVAVLMCR